MGDHVPSTLQLETVSNADRAVVIVRGDVDAATAPQLQVVIDAVLEDVPVLELDLTDLGFMDSTGLGVIASALRTLVRIEGSLELRRPPASLLRLLDITDLSRFVQILDVDT